MGLALMNVLARDGIARVQDLTAPLLVVSFVLASARPYGSVIITATPAGEWYLYGGALGCAAGTVTAFFVRVRRSARPR